MNGIHEQLSMARRVDADELVAQARVQHAPIASFCLFSGGGDSAVLAHRCREHYESLVFIDTGTAVPGVREHVERFAAWLEKPLRVYDSTDAFRRMVLGGYVMSNGEVSPALGFPGPAQHGRAYTRLKERQIEALVRDAKNGHARSVRVLLLTGVRRAESARRSKRMPITRRGGSVFVNPLIDWMDREMAEYRATHEFPQSDVVALLHRSGECNCGAYAQLGEREMLRDLWPEWFERTIGSLEREAEDAGISMCRWGNRPIGANGASGSAGPLCSSCEALFEDS